MKTPYRTPAPAAPKRVRTKWGAWKSQLRITRVRWGFFLRHGVLPPVPWRERWERCPQCKGRQPNRNSSLYTLLTLLPFSECFCGYLRWPASILDELAEKRKRKKTSG